MKDEYTFWDDEDPDEKWRSQGNYPWKKFEQEKDFITCIVCCDFLNIPPIHNRSFIKKEGWVEVLIQGSIYYYCPSCKSLINE